MIALIKLDAGRHCLHRMTGGGGSYLCRRPRDHDGAHDYLPIDLVIVAAPRRQQAPSPAADTTL